MRGPLIVGAVQQTCWTAMASIDSMGGSVTIAMALSGHFLPRKTHGAITHHIETDAKQGNILDQERT